MKSDLVFSRKGLVTSNLGFEKGMESMYWTIAFEETMHKNRNFSLSCILTV
jgi:hypothetical protein